MADTPKSVWQIVWEFCGHFSTAIWLTSVLIGITLWLLSLHPVVKGGIGSLLIALSVISIINRVATNHEASFLTLGNVGRSTTYAATAAHLHSDRSTNVTKRAHVIDTLKALIKEGTEIATCGDYPGGFIAMVPENQEKFNRIDAYKPRVLRFLKQYADDGAVKLFEEQEQAALEEFLKQLLEDENATSINSTTGLSLNNERNVDIGTLDCSAYSDEENQIQGALVIAENEFTGRKYKATTSRYGEARLQVPYGNYSVSIEAEKYLPRTEAVKVGEGLAHISFEMHMVRAAREQHVNEMVSSLIQGLTEFSATGGELLSKAEANPTNEVREEVAKWEKQTLAFLESRISKAEATLFSSAAPVEVYPILSATAAHRHVLDHINTRVVRLNNLIRRFQDQLDEGMLY